MSVERPSWAPSEVDITRPSVVRVYDFYLGGPHDVESDGEFGQAALRAFPGLPAVLREGRDSLRRIVPADPADDQPDAGDDHPLVAGLGRRR